MRAMTDSYNRHAKFMLEEGSRFRGVRDPAALPSLGYRVVQMITVYEPLPRGKSLGGGVYYPDYDQVVRRWSGEFMGYLHGGGARHQAMCAFPQARYSSLVSTTIANRPACEASSESRCSRRVRPAREGSSPSVPPAL
jgi:hypothetical protein